MKAVPSTYHQTIKFPTKWGVREIRGDQKLARECYAASLKFAAKECFVTTISEERSRRYIEPETEKLDEVVLDSSFPDRKVRIGSNLDDDSRERLLSFLRSNSDCFAWSHEDMVGIPPDVATDRKSTRLNSSHRSLSRMPSSA